MLRNSDLSRDLFVSLTPCFSWVLPAALVGVNRFNGFEGTSTRVQVRLGGLKPLKRLRAAGSFRVTQLKQGVNEMGRGRKNLNSHPRMDTDKHRWKFILRGANKRGSIPPHPNPLPKERGTFACPHQIAAALTSAHGSVAPSPWGEGWGEGERDRGEKDLSDPADTL